MVAGRLTLLGTRSSPNSGIVVDDKITFDQGFVYAGIVKLVQLGEGDDAAKKKSSQ